MEETLIKKFKNLHVRIVLKPDFILDGVITEIGESGFIFETSQKSSYIAFEQILQISPINNEVNKKDD